MRLQITQGMDEAPFVAGKWIGNGTQPLEYGDVGLGRIPTTRLQPCPQYTRPLESALRMNT